MFPTVRRFDTLQLPIQQRKEVRKMSWIIAISGVALAVAPFIFGYSSNLAALATSISLGAAVALAGFIKALTKGSSKGEYWVAATVGLVGVIAPFGLGFSAITGALWSMLLLGGLVVILAGYEVLKTPKATTHN
jgi:uncharacterized membrane protein HdeD (DUF308 family)